jgi:hypothetical protein
MNYSTGEMEVGGVLGISGTGARVRINDPFVDANHNGIQDPGESGRYGRAMSPTVGSWSIRTTRPSPPATGLPDVLPPGRSVGHRRRRDRSAVPQGNRPISTGLNDALGAHPPAGQFDTLFRMPHRLTASFRIPGSGTVRGRRLRHLRRHPDRGRRGEWRLHLRAHDHRQRGIYTQPGVDPAYVSTEVALIGTGGLTVFGAGEAAVRTRFEGMTTDETRRIHLYGIDINPSTGATSDRDWGTIMPDPVRQRRSEGPLALPPAVPPVRLRFEQARQGMHLRARQRFLPPAREVRAVIEGHQQFLPGTSTPNPCQPGSGYSERGHDGERHLLRQYHAPIGEYIFPENVPGTPIVENNFNTIDFLVFGGYSSFTGVIAGRPQPVAEQRLPAIASVRNTDDQRTVLGRQRSEHPVVRQRQRQRNVTRRRWRGRPARRFGGTDLNAALTNATTTTPTFNATGLAPGPYNVRLTASNVCGSAFVDSTITVAAAPAPTINALQDQTVTLGSAAASPVTVVATTGSLPAPTFAWTRTGGTGPAVACHADAGRRRHPPPRRR